MYVQTGTRTPLSTANALFTRCFPQHEAPLPPPRKTQSGNSAQSLSQNGGGGAAKAPQASRGAATHRPGRGAGPSGPRRAAPRPTPPARRGRATGRTRSAPRPAPPRPCGAASLPSSALTGRRRCQSRAFPNRHRVVSPCPAPGLRAPLPGKLAVGRGGWSSELAGSSAASLARGPSAAGLAAAGLEAAGRRDEAGAPSRPVCEPGPGQQERRPRPPACLSQMEASLTCAVCLSLFEEPVTLPLCSHNFCRGCVLECLASAEAARLQQQQQQRGQGQAQARLSRGGPGAGAGAGGGAAGARVSCPLCRKLCPLPRGGAAALPVNTTLAEVVKLYRSGAAGAAKAGEAEPGQGPGLLSPLALGGTCHKHPSRLVQLYCRMCRQAGCGQCVSEEHQGIFHSVNLMDTVYQEEKVSAALPLRAGGPALPRGIPPALGCSYWATQ